MAAGGSRLDAVYGAASAEEVARSYDGWAETYEAEMAAAGYRHPAICLALLARRVPRGAGPILDAGAGTGLVGQWLGIVGYPDAEALDISQGMLDVAAAKGVYARLHCCSLGGRLPFEDARFAGVISAGVFTTGHVGGEALPELIRVLRPGGALVLTVKDRLWRGGFADRLEELAAAGEIELVEQTPPYVSMPGVADTSPSRALAMLRIAPRRRRRPPAPG